MAAEMKRLPSIAPTSMRRTGSVCASNQLVVQAVKLQADKTAISSSASPAPREEQVRQLRDGQDVNEIEKELDWLDPGSVVARRVQQETTPLAASERIAPAHARNFVNRAPGVPVTRPPS